MVSKTLNYFLLGFASYKLGILSRNFSFNEAFPFIIVIVLVIRDFLRIVEIEKLKDEDDNNKGLGD